MKILKAIEIQKAYIYDGAYEGTELFIDALKLGIEALEWRKQMEYDYGGLHLHLLPGETED